MQKIYVKYLNYRPRILLAANYLFIFYAFMIPIDPSFTRDIFSLILVLFVLHGDYLNKIKFVLKNNVIISFILFLSMHFVWMYGSENIQAADFKAEAFRYVIYTMLYITMIRQDFVYKIISAFLFSMFFSEITSYLISMEIIEPIRFASVDNPVPFMLSHIQYSSVLSISIGIIVFLILKNNSNKYLKILYLLFFLSASINLFIIDSRMGYALFAVSIFISLLAYKKKILKISIISLIIVSFFYISAYNFSNSFKYRVDLMIDGISKVYTMNSYASSTGTRIGLYIYSIDVFKNNPIFGVGTADHIDEVIKEITDKEESRENRVYLGAPLHSGYHASLHSEYFDILVQFGIIGLLVFLNIFYQLFVYIQKDPYLKTIQIILVFIGLVISIPSVIFIYGTLGKVFTLLAALTLTMYHGKDGNPIVKKKE